MSVKILITPRSFAKFDKEPFELLKKINAEVVINPYGRILTKQEMISLVGDIDGIIVGVDPIDQEVMDSAPKLKAIAKYGVGTDNIDLDYAKEKDIPVTITEGANKDAVAEYTIALMLSVARKVVQIDNECRKLNWSKITTIDTYGKTLGLIGVGQIGKTVVKRLKGFDMNILAYDLHRDDKFAKENNMTYIEQLDELLKKSDFISLHLPLNESTKNIIGKRELQLMKENAILINTARGGLIDEDALLVALEHNYIWGAGLDVFKEEPPTNKKLLANSNLVIGSHCAASTQQATINMGRVATKQLIESLNFNV